MKFNAEDQSYLSERKTFAREFRHEELWEAIDHWPLYVGIANLGRFMAIRDLLMSTRQVPGHVAEFGSWRGANLMFLAKLLRLQDPHGSKRVHCFESFEGLSTFSEEDGESSHTEGAYQGKHAELSALINLYRLQDDIVINQGDILETLPAFMEANPAAEFSFVYCDTDLYAPSKLILEQMHPRLSKGGLVVFDEWNDERWPGESLAVREFMQTHGNHYSSEHIPGARQPTLALRKVSN